jgi:hypothetical protein
MSDMEQQSDDIEQVFIVNDTDDSSGNDRKPFSSTGGRNLNGGYYVSEEDTKKFVKSSTSLMFIAVAIFAFVFFIGMFFAIEFKLKPETLGLFCMLSFILLMSIIVLAGSDEAPVSVNEPVPSVQANERISKNKYNTVEEFNNSPDGRLHRANIEAEKARQEIQAEAEKRKQDEEGISIAVQALVALGFKKKRAISLVTRGVSSGITAWETQSLVRYALANNNKA